MARKRATPLQQVLKQGRGFRDKGHEALLDLVVTTDVLRRGVTRVLEPHGITVQQYNVMRILRGAGPDGLPTLEIAERMIERTPGITGLIDRLERRGWVKRVRSTADRRLVVCMATAAGLALLETLDPVVTAFEKKVVGALDANEQARLVELLDKLRGGCE